MPADPDAPVRQLRFRPAPGSCDLLLVRHGESQPAVADAPFPVVDGHSDPPLAAHGHDEAQRVAVRLAGEEISAIYVTPLQRTQQTAEPLAARLELTPRVISDLAEVHLGEWEGGLYRIRMREGHPTARQVILQQDWSLIPGAEAYGDFATRVRRGISAIADAHPDERVAAFVHGGVIGMALHLATGSEPFSFIGAENGSLSHVVISDSRWILRRFNDTGHLATDLDRPVQPLT